MTAVSNANMAQIKAAQPSSSTWVSANAGSGKTKVLIDRESPFLRTIILNKGTKDNIKMGMAIKSFIN